MGSPSIEYSVYSLINQVLSLEYLFLQDGYLAASVRLAYINELTENEGRERGESCASNLLNPSLWRLWFGCRCQKMSSQVAGTHCDITSQ